MLTYVAQHLTDLELTMVISVGSLLKHRLLANDNKLISYLVRDKNTFHSPCKRLPGSSHKPKTKHPHQGVCA